MKKFYYSRVLLVETMISSMGIGMASAKNIILRIGSGHPSKPAADEGISC